MDTGATPGLGFAVIILAAVVAVHGVREALTIRRALQAEYALADAARTHHVDAGSARTTDQATPAT